MIVIIATKSRCDLLFMREELQVEGWVSLKDSVDVVENKSAHLYVGYRNPVDTPYTALMEIIPLIFN